MKKNLISILALLIAIVSLVLSVICYGAVREAPTYYSDRLFELNRENEELHAQLEALAARLEALESGTVTPVCNLLVDSWVEEEGALTLTGAYIEVQLPADATIETAQLVLLHNGRETSRIDISLESTEAAGLYRRSLTDTWFVLPEMADDDSLDLYLEVALSNGALMTATGISWYRNDGTLHSVVG